MTYRFRAKVPLSVKLQGQVLEREEFFAWIWREFEPLGIEGVHEGTCLSESWTVDSAAAPPERDWVGGQAVVDAVLYFSGQEGAQKAQKILKTIPGIVAGDVEEEVMADWNEEWKKKFLENPEGVHIPPFWQVIPPWVKPTKGDVKYIKINPGAGFGTGTHETTQLCLQAIGETSPVERGLLRKRVLDFGSGSGILSISAALLGAAVWGVETDPLAIDNARENAALNGVAAQIRFFDKLDPESLPFEIIVANILKPVLISFAETLVSKLSKAKGSSLILSGLLESDVKEVTLKYKRLLDGCRSEVRKRGEWRALIWRPM